MNPPKVVRTRGAQNDFRRIYAWIAYEGGHARAVTVLSRIETTIERLALHPRIGRVRKDFDGDPRVFSVAPWMIVYEALPDEAGIQILRLIDGRRDLAALLGKKS